MNDELLMKLCRPFIDVSIDYRSDAKQPWTIKILTRKSAPYLYHATKGTTFDKAASRALGILNSDELIYKE